MATDRVNYIAFNNSAGMFCISLDAVQWLADRGWLPAYSLLQEFKSYGIARPEEMKIDETMLEMTRHTPLLSLCIKDLGSAKASGPGASVEIWETTSSSYTIRSAGGFETVIVPSDIRWVVIE